MYEDYLIKSRVTGTLGNSSLTHNVLLSKNSGKHINSPDITRSAMAILQKTFSIFCSYPAFPFNLYFQENISLIIYYFLKERQILLINSYCLHKLFSQNICNPYTRKSISIWIACITHFCILLFIFKQ